MIPSGRGGSTLPALFAGLTALSPGVGLGCIDERSDPHGPPPCTGSRCAQPTGGLGSGVGAGGGDAGPTPSAGAGGAETADVDGTVRLMADPAFEQTQTQAFGGDALVLAQPMAPGASLATAEYAGGAFTLEDVVTGDAWLVVRSADPGGAGVLSSITVQVLPPSDALVLPLVDQIMMEGILATLPGQPQLADGATHVALAFVRDDAPLAGVTMLDTNSPDGLVAFDLGAPGEYDSSALETGTAGKLLVLNATPPVAGELDITVADADGTPYPLHLRVEAGAMTIVGYDLRK